MKKRRRQAEAGSVTGPQTARALEYALSGWAKELTRLLSEETRKQDGKLSTPTVLALLSESFRTVFIGPVSHRKRAAAQRHTLAFLLAAADVPDSLKLTGVPAELRKRRRKGR